MEKILIRRIIILGKIINNYIKWKLGFPSPFYTLYYCTFRCNLSCLFCPIISYPPENKGCLFSQKYSLGKENEMTTSQAKYFIDQLGKIGIYFILFGGGEPLLREDLEELAGYAKNRNILTALSTNGTLITDERAKSLMSCFDSIMVSVHGSEDIDDKIKQREGSFKKTIEGLKLLKKYPGAKVGINFVINKCNYHQIEDIFIFAKENCDFINYISVNCDFGPAFSLGEEISKGIVRKILKLKEKNQNFIINTKEQLSLFADHLSGKRIPIKCNAFDLFTQVGPAGEFGGCERAFVVGNILNINIKELIKLGKGRKGELQDNCKEIVCDAHLPYTPKLSMFKFFDIKILIAKFFKNTNL